jgi:hypothetical protein
MGKDMTTSSDNEKTSNAPIARYDGFGIKNLSGKYVTYADHCSEMEALKAMIERKNKALAAPCINCKYVPKQVQAKEGRDEH